MKLSTDNREYLMEYINKIIHGDCLDKLKELEDNSVDAVVTDPPYGLSFMGKKWDYDVPSVEIWEECLRVLKPGGYLLSFAGTRTQHRMAVRIEDAGFEIRDMIAWVYGSGFPKSLNIGKAVDKLQGNEREVTGEKILGGIKRARPDNAEGFSNPYTSGQTIGIETKGTSEWEGWGTALKPAIEPITVARKPLSEKTVAENVLKWGTGGINIDESRVKSDDWDEKTVMGKYIGNNENNESVTNNFGVKEIKCTSPESTLLGRFPANFIHDGSDEVVDLFPNDSQRFFYCAKASKSERNKGCEGLEDINVSSWHFKCEVCGHTYAEQKEKSGCHCENPKPIQLTGTSKNNHPTVKPIALMEYLIKMVTPKGGIVLDPFAGSGSTLVAAKQNGFNYVGIEMTEEYLPIINARIGL